MAWTALARCGARQEAAERGPRSAFALRTGMSVLGPSRKQLRRRGIHPRGHWANLVGQTSGRGEIVAVFVVLGLVGLLALALATMFSARSPTRGLAQIGAQFARPSVDIATGFWVTVPLWDKLDEATPDEATTEIQSGTDPINDPFEGPLS